MNAKHFIKEWRVHRGVTQVELARAMDMSRSYLTMIERGRRPYNQDFLEGAAAALETTPANLIARPPGSNARIDAMLAAVSDDERSRIEAAIRALISTNSNE